MPPDKLSLIVLSGDFERVHYALSMASAAIAVNTPVTLFFTMSGVRALAKPQADGAPGWTALGAASDGDTAARDASLGALGVATFEELIEACISLGVTFMVCEMGLRAVGLERRDLRDDIDIATAGLVSFFHDASADGSIVLI